MREGAQIVWSEPPNAVQDGRKTSSQKFEAMSLPGTEPPSIWAAILKIRSAAGIYISTAGQSERVVDAIRATAADTEGDVADMVANDVMTRRLSAHRIGSAHQGDRGFGRRSHSPGRTFCRFRR